MKASSKISSDYRITIPKAIRETKGWQPGQKLAFIPSGLGYKLVPVPKFEDLVGITKGISARNYRDRNDRY